MLLFSNIVDIFVEESVRNLDFFMIGGREGIIEYEGIIFLC